MSSFFRSQQDILSITLLSIANLLLLELSQGLPDSFLYLNYSVYYFHSQSFSLVLLFPNSYNFLLYVQNLCNCNSFSCSLLLLHMDYALAWTLPISLVLWLLHLFLLLLLEQALLVSAAEPPTSLAKFEAMISVAIMSLWYLLLYFALVLKALLSL